MKQVMFIILGAFTLLVALKSCSVDDTVPENPYDGIDRTIEEKEPLEFENEFAEVHEKVFALKCANPGCHDGNFEPDFRTIQSSYGTLVYQPIVKNNAEESFKYRVVPGNSEASVLYERISNCCFVNEDDRMPQDNIGEPLDDAHIALIKNWIDNGAKDLFGNEPTLPDNLPTVSYFAAFNQTYVLEYSQNRKNGNFYEPFVMPKNSVINLVVVVTDDATEVKDLSINELKIADNKDDFSSAKTYQATYVEADGNELWVATFNSAEFDSNKQWYMRYYVQDDQNPEVVEYPNDEVQDAFKSFWSFVY